MFIAGINKAKKFRIVIVKLFLKRLRFILSYCSGQLLNTKPELLKKMDERKSKLKDEERKKAIEDRRTSFDIKMAEQANKLLQVRRQSFKI